MKNKIFKFKSFALFCLFIAIGILTPFNSLTAQNVQKTFNNDGLHCIYQVKDGMLNGDYQSFYANGNKKSMGSFNNNNRSGLWAILDSTGNIIVKESIKITLNTNKYFL